MKSKVIIAIFSYNNEENIATAIESVLQQETSFKYKIIIIDDASTDKTIKIIKSYMTRYPCLIKCILSKEHVGKAINKLRLYSILDSDYYAMLDGDDLWLDKDRLQYQYDFLEKYKDFSACMGQVKCLSGNEIGKGFIHDSILDTVYTVENYFVNPIKFPVAGALFRNIYKEDIIDFVAYKFADIEKEVVRNDMFDILVNLEKMPMYILPKTVALYRTNHKNCVSNLRNSIELVISDIFWRAYYSNKSSDKFIGISEKLSCDYQKMWNLLIKKIYPKYNLSLVDSTLLQKITRSLINEEEKRKKVYCFSNIHKYEEKLTSRKRFISIGFDDFRNSDFSVIAPLLKEYGFSATFNRIHENTELSYTDIAKLDSLLVNKNEIGDHTWFHANFIYNDPLFNGQDPNNLEGDQIPFPSNDELRKNRGDGKNVFGIDLEECVSTKFFGWHILGACLPDINTEWKNLSDEECQIIRNTYSIYKDKSGLLKSLDELSNTYLGTQGYSFGSYNRRSGYYTGGIFTGARTSANHEIWERILAVTKSFFYSKYSENFKFTTWSFPGTEAQFLFGYEKNNHKYYDSKFKQHCNNLAKFESSTILDNNGNKLKRSWIEVLRDAGYTITHDVNYPSRTDGQKISAMRKQMIFNGHLSRYDALAYPTNRTISWTSISDLYNEDFFDNNKGIASQMYEDGRDFYNCIEAIRHETANGMIHGEVIDSFDTYSMRTFLCNLFDYCKSVGIEVISKDMAYDICFNHSIKDGNIIYNQELRNTAKEFLIDANNVPQNPDGYIGDCEVYSVADNKNILLIKGETYYLHYGIPYGKIRYSVQAKGTGKIDIYCIKNSDDVELINNQLTKLSVINLSSDIFKYYECNFIVPNNSCTEYEDLCEGLGNKIMGLKIVYSTGLCLYDISLENIE